MSEEPADNPYRPGFAVELDDDGPPRLVNLLERHTRVGFRNR